MCSPEHISALATWLVDHDDLDWFSFNEIAIAMAEQAFIGKWRYHFVDDPEVTTFGYRGATPEEICQDIFGITRNKFIDRCCKRYQGELSPGQIHQLLTSYRSLVEEQPYAPPVFEDTEDRRKVLSAMDDIELSLWDYLPGANDALSFI
jgi:hypothetical protein